MANEASLKEAFDLHDHGGAGSIASSELGNALRSVGKRLTEENVSRLKKKADDEMGGKVTFDGFKGFYEQASQVEKRDEDIQKAFEVFAEEKGQVNVADLKHALTTLGDKLSMDEVNTLLQDAGFDPKTADTIDYDSFMKLIQSNV